MSFSFVPNCVFRRITDIKPDFLHRLGIKFLMVDTDNTLAAYGEAYPSDLVIRWVEGIKSAGIDVFIISNNVREGRVEAFSAALGVGYIKGAKKPSPKGLRRAMDQANYDPDKSALVGDQIYTDTLAANLAGITSIVIRPRRFSNPLLVIRFILEAPFRALCLMINRKSYEQNR